MERSRQSETAAKKTHCSIGRKTPQVNQDPSRDRAGTVIPKILTLCQQSPNIPPLVPQQAISQQAYCAHEVEVTAHGGWCPTYTTIYCGV
ncbi:hypothetical protein N7465_002024 [Penicillium sp. CMV-2018d]|nr:hypothetical protein N7465_002024 [Penicillium sp. CMV-2018d]